MWSSHASAFRRRMLPLSTVRRHAPSPRLNLEPLEDRLVPSGFSDIVVFGDSLSDTGNFYVATGGVIARAPYFPGHFSNGPVWDEVMAQQLGLPAPSPSLLGGTNYAWGGAEAGPGLSVFGSPNVGPQIDAFLAGPGTLASNELVVVWAGANDVVWHPSASPAAIVDNLANDVTRLAAVGGKTFLMPNEPAFGETPLFRSTADEVRINTQLSQVNHLLNDKVEDLENQLGITILRPNVAGLFNQILNHPEHFDLSNVTDPACPGCGIGNPSPNAGSTIVPNPGAYLWWDFIHPTQGIHALIGNQAARVVADDGDNAMFFQIAHPFVGVASTQTLVASASTTLNNTGARGVGVTTDPVLTKPDQLQGSGAASGTLSRPVYQGPAPEMIDQFFAGWDSGLTMPLLA